MKLLLLPMDSWQGILASGELRPMGRRQGILARGEVKDVSVPSSPGSCLRADQTRKFPGHSPRRGGRCTSFSRGRPGEEDEGEGHVGGVDGRRAEAWRVVEGRYLPIALEVFAHQQHRHLLRQGLPVGPTSSTAMARPAPAAEPRRQQECQFPMRML